MEVNGTPVGVKDEGIILIHVEGNPQEAIDWDDIEE